MQFKEVLWNNELNRTILLGLILAVFTLVSSIMDYYYSWYLQIFDIFDILHIKKTYPLIEDITLVIDVRMIVRILLGIFFFIGSFFALLTYMEKQAYLLGWTPVILLTFATECIIYFLWDYRFVETYTKWWQYLGAWHTIYVLIGIILFVAYVNHSSYEY